MNQAIIELLKPFTGPAGEAGGDAAALIEDLEKRVTGSEDKKNVAGRLISTVKDPNWTDLQNRAAAVLKQNSKHLRAGVVYCMAATQCSSWNGLRDGLELIAGLLEGFKDNLRPLLDNGDPYERATILNDLSLPISKPGDPYNFVFRVQRLKITDSSGQGSFSFLEMRAARDSTRDLLGSEIEPPSVEQIAAAWTAMTADRQTALDESLSAALAALDRITKAFKDKKSKPQLSLLNGTLQEIAKAVKTRGQREAQATEGAEQPGGQQSSGPDTRERGQANAAFPAQIQNRSQALKSLDAVRKYFEQNEPSSPIPKLLSLALEVGAMDFVKVFKRLTPTAM